jgi:hypothetical protein
LLVEAKQFAIETDRTLRAVIEDALREVLARRRSAPQRERVELPTSGEGGLRPGVSLDNTSELLDLMDQHDGPA